MIRLVLGYKERNTRAVPEVVYVGHDGTEAQKRLEDPGKGMAYAELCQVQTLKRHTPLSAAEKKAKEDNAKTEQKAKDEAEKAKAKALEVAEKAEPKAAGEPKPSSPKKPTGAAPSGVAGAVSQQPKPQQ
jgi:FtsZ-interacting cell division protein ZipA